MEAAAFPLLWGAERETAASPLAPSLFMERSAPALPKRHEASQRLLNPAGDRRRCGGHKAGWLAQRGGVLPPRFLTRSGKTQLDNNLPTTRPDLRGSRCGQKGKKHQNVVYKWVFHLDISGSKGMPTRERCSGRKQPSTQVTSAQGFASPLQPLTRMQPRSVHPYTSVPIPMGDVHGTASNLATSRQ